MGLEGGGVGGKEVEVEGDGGGGGLEGDDTNSEVMIGNLLFIYLFIIEYFDKLLHPAQFLVILVNGVGDSCQNRFTKIGNPRNIPSDLWEFVFGSRHKL